MWELKTNTKEIKENLTKKIKEAYILSLKAGTTRAKAAEAANVDVSTIWQWAKDDEQFAKDIEIALESRINVVVDALYSNAIGRGEYTNSEGKKIVDRGNVIAQIFWTKNRGKGKWRDKQEVDLKVPDTINIKHFIQAGKEPVIKEEEELPMKEKEVLEEPRDDDIKEIETVL